MKPTKPVMKNPPEGVEALTYAEDQPEYQPLPTLCCADGTVVSRWHLDFWERLQVLFFGDVYLYVWTFGRALQPVLLETTPPRFMDETLSDS